VRAGLDCYGQLHRRYCHHVAAQHPTYTRNVIARSEGFKLPKKQSPEPTAIPPVVVPYSRHPIYARFGRRERIRIATGRVLCASDSAQFVPLQMMLASLLLTHEVGVSFVDLGLAPLEREWVLRQGVEIILPQRLPVAQSVPSWQSWNKPFYFPDRGRWLWLDNDIVIDGDLRPVFEAISKGIVVPRDYFAPDPTIMENAHALYERFPTHRRIPSACAGVVGLEGVRDRVVMSRWRSMVEQAAKDESVRSALRWWDQGALIWALEGTNVDPVDRIQWNRPGRAHVNLGLTARTPKEMLDSLPKGEATIWHFQGTPKPYAWDPDFDLSLREPSKPLEVWILGHESFERPARTWLRNVNQTEHDPDQSWGECRVFDRDDLPETEYLGFATWSWTEKYEQLRAWAPWEFGELELAPDRVWTAQATTCLRFLQYPEWRDHVEHYSPGMGKVIDTIRLWSGRPEVRTSAWSNNWVMHRDVFRDLLAFYRQMKRKVVRKWGKTPPFAAWKPEKAFGYVGEAITVHYLATRADLDIREMRRPVRGEFRRLAIECKHRGCPTGCQHAICRRDVKEVHLSDCVRCKIREATPGLHMQT
jgi:hypothetical protein